MRGAGQSDEGRWAFGIRWVEGQIDRATLRTTLTYRVVPRLALGIEWNPLANDVNPLGNLLLVEETRERPAVMLGTSSDRIGTPFGQSYYGTVSKNLKPLLDIPIAPYVGAAYGTFDDTLRAIAGGNIEFPKNFSSLIIYDGVNVHPTASWTWKRHTFTFLLVDLKHPGIAYSVAFDTPGRSTPHSRRPSEPFTRPGWPR